LHLLILFVQTENCSFAAHSDDSEVTPEMQSFLLCAGSFLTLPSLAITTILAPRSPPSRQSTKIKPKLNQITSFNH
jgi:hypothetical protein